MAINRSVALRQRNGRFSNINLNQEHENELEETISLNEAAFMHTARASITEGMAETRLGPPATGRSPQMARRELIGRTTARNALKKMPSEPSGLTTLFKRDAGNRRENTKTKPLPLENYSVLEEIGDSGYGKLYRIKRLADGKSFSLKCVAHQMQRPENDDTSSISRSDAQALAILVRELLAQYRVNGHPNFLTMQDCWFTLYDSHDTPPTPSLGQPFDLNRFSLDRFRRHLATSGGDQYDEDEELVDFELYGIRLLTALMKEQPFERRAAAAGRETIMIALFMVLDYCQYDLQDYFAARQETLAQSGNSSLQWKFFLELIRMSLLLYDYDLVHLGIQASSLGVAALANDQLVPRLMDFGINRYFEAYISHTRYNPLRKSVYQAPEVENAQRVPELSLTWPSDVYSLGILVVRFCSPIAKKERTKSMKLVKAGNLDVLDNFTNIPSDLRVVLKRMLAAEPDHRPTPWEILESIMPALARENDTTTGFSDYATFIASRKDTGAAAVPESCWLRLSFEMEMLQSRLQYRNWLKQVPDSLWLGVVQSCAKEMLERYLEHLSRLVSDECMDSSTEVSLTTFDLQFMLGGLHMDAEMTKCVDNATKDKEQLLIFAVWYLWRKYERFEGTGASEAAATNGTTGNDASEEAFWMREVKRLYLDFFGNAGN